MKQIRIDAPQHRLVGQSVQRPDTVGRLTGRAVFAEDVHLPGMLQGRVLRSPHAHARIKRLDASRAEALPGVHAVMTAADLPAVRFGKYLADERYVAAEGDTVLFVGDRVAAVAAETLELADEALALIEVEYEPLEPVTDALRALEADAPVLHPELASYRVHAMAKPTAGNCCSDNVLQRGDPDAAFKRAHRVFEEVYTTEMVHQAYIEPHAFVATYNPDDSYTVWSTTQHTFGLRNLIATVLGVSQNRVRVIGTEVGGAFGGKIALKEEATAACLARKSGRPVRIVLTRHEDFLIGEPRSGFHIKIRTGVTEDMRLLARTMEIVLDSGAFARAGVLTCSAVPGFAEGPYAIEHLRIHSRCAYTNKASTASMRAPGGPQTNFAIESEMERIAEELGWDPIEFRRRNLMPESHTSLAGVEMRCVNVKETLDAALEAAQYQPRGAQAGAAPGPRRGRGLALGNWNVGGMPSGAVLKMNDDGSASVLTGVIDLTGVHTAIAQVAAEALELSVEQVTIQALDTESAPHSTISAGSQALKSMGGAVLLAAEHVKAQLFEEAVESLDATPERMELVGDEVRVKDAPAGSAPRAVKVTALLAKAMARRGPIVGYGSTGNFSRLPSFAAQVADVEVDPDTGQVRVLRYVAAQDCGIAINPVAVDGQVQGGAVQGIGMALMEGLRYDATGKPLTAGFLDYKIPSAPDLPPIETVLVEKPAVDGPFGAKGIGEPPCVPGPAAIANAIYDAVGVRITSLPITPEKVRAALRSRERAAAAD